MAPYNCQHQTRLWVIVQMSRSSAVVQGAFSFKDVIVSIVFSILLIKKEDADRDHADVGLETHLRVIPIRKHIFKHIWISSAPRTTKAIKKDYP
jgi:hypothetical protein